ncbi:MAG: hypothetical protein JWN70_1953, partial [Planctomycetaceae bacterium]|nr:hypothetical protein [Planctomycetaceae bacterium]
NFEADAESVLVVVSPDGRPFLYELAPQTWGPGIRRVTLRVPDVRRVHHGQVRVLFGNLVPGLPVEIETVRSNGLLWEIFSEQEVPSFRRSLWNARATDGTPIRQIRTAADGRYSVPIYFGSAVRFRGFGNGGTLVDPAGLGADEFSVWKPDTKYKFEKSQFEPVRVMKLVFEDEQGQPVQGILCRDVPLYSREGEIIMRGASCGEDARGQYLFVNSPFDEVQIEIECSQKRWLPQRINIKNRGAAEQVVHVKLDPSKRRGWPLAGRVLNPDGTGAQRARVLLYKATSEKRNRYGNDYLHLDATTDNDGKFLFDAAPDQCYIEIEPVRNEWGPGLQGWSSPLAVDSQTRDVQIRLQRGGSLKLLLPTDLGPGAEHFYLRRENVPDDLPLRLRNTYFTRGADQHERLANVLEPGSYLLDNSESDTDELLAELGKVRAEVRVGEQTVIDLRDQKIPAARALAARPKSWTTIVVKHDNQVVSGAEVVVLANVARADDLSRWIAGTASDDRQVRETAIRMLQRAGAQAVDAIRSSSEKLDRDELFKSFEDVVSDGLYQVIRDLSDDQGQVRCEVETGRNCIAVARVRGRMIGWLSFVSNGETLSVPLQPARTLVIQREEAEPLIRPSFTQVRPMFPAVAHIRLEEPTSKEVRGLIAVLCEVVYGFPPQPGWVQREAIFDHLYSVRSERRGEWVVEDLPMGAVCTIALPERRNDDPDTKPKPPDQHRITIERGSGVQFAKW